MSSDTSNSGIMQKADQIAFHFYTKLFYIINQARTTEESHSQGKIDKWFNLETPDSDLFTRDAREPYRNISLSPPPPLEIQVLLCIPELTNNQVLVHRSDDTMDDPPIQQPSSSARSTLRIEPTPRFIVLETWTLTFVPHGHNQRFGDQALPTIYKHGIPLFRSVYSLLRVLPVWKLYKRLKRRTGGINRNGHLAISLRVRPLQETNQVAILSFDSPPSPSHDPLPTQTQTFSPLPHPLGSLTLSATYLSTPNFELDELESHLSSRFISLDLQGFVPTLSKHAVRDEKEDSNSGGGGDSVGPRSPPRAIVGATGGRGGHAHSHGLGLGLPSESTGSIDGTGRPITAPIIDNASVAERFIIPSRIPSLNLAITSSSSSSALIPPPRPQFTPLQLPLPFPTVGGTVSSSSASGVAMHRMRRESSNSSPITAAAAAGPGVGTGDGSSPSAELFPSSISPHQTPHSPHPYIYPPPSLSSSPVSSAGMGGVPIRRPGSRMGINPFKAHTLSSGSVSASASGSSPSLSIRQGLPSGVAAGGGGSPLSTGVSASFARGQPPSVASSTRVAFPPPPSGYGTTPSSLGDRKVFEREYRTRMSSESERGDWDRDDKGRRGSSEDSSRERDGYRRASVGYPTGLGNTTPSGTTERPEDVTGAGGVGVPTRIPPTRKRYSSSFGNRYVGSIGSAGSGGVGSGAGESGGSTPASVSAGTGATGGVGGDEKGKGKEQAAAGGIASFLSTATDDDDISIFVQDIDARKPLSGRVKEREKRERDKEREMAWGRERDRDRDREEEGQDHDREAAQEDVKGKGKAQKGELVTSSVPRQRQRQRSPLSPLSALEREVRQQPILSSETETTLPTLGTNTESTGLTSPVSATTATVHSQSPRLSTSPLTLAQLSTSPNRGPMLTNQDEVEERLRRMNETFMRSLEGMGKGSVRRREKEKGKEKETERDGTRRKLSLLVSPSEAEASSGGHATNDDGPFMLTRTTSSRSSSPSQTGERRPTNSIRIPSPSSTSTGTGSSSSSNQAGGALHSQAGLGLGLGLGRGFVRSTSASASTSTSSEAIGTSQGSEEVIGRMDFYDESLGMGRRLRRF